MKKQSFWLVNRLFLLKIVLPALLTMVLFIVSLYQIIIPRFESIIMDRKREMTRELVNNTWHIADHYHREALARRMSEAEARQRTIEQVRHLRYGDEAKDYFWITDFHPVMIVHPFREELNGSDLTNFTDSRGKRLFVEMVKLVRNEGEGFVDYTWQWKDDSTRIVPKLSYVKPFHPWGWVIGTGIYVEDVKAEIAGLEQNIVTISLWITVATALLLLFMAGQNLRSEKQRYTAENELREAKERYQALVEASTEGLLMLLDDDQVYCNRTLQTMLGYTEEETKSVDMLKIFPELTELQVHNLTGTGQQGGIGLSHAETRLLRKDGASLEVLLTPSPIQFFGKQGIVIIVKDIGHHKQIVNELDESREKFLALTNRLSLAVFRTDAAGDMRFMEANAAALALFGFVSETDIQSTGFRDRVDEPHIFEAMNKELFGSGVISNRIVRCRRKDNSSVILSLSIVAVKDENGVVRCCDCLAEDVSEHKRAEQSTESLVADLQAPLLYLNQPIAPFVRDAQTCGMNEPLGKVMRIMARLQADVVMVKQDNGDVVGMIDSDSMYDRLMEGRTADVPAFEAMSAPVHFVRTSAAVYDVLDGYLQRGVKYYGVRNEAGAVIGTVNVDDVQKSQLSNHLFFLQRLQHAETVAEVEHCRARLQLYARMLIERGASVRSIARATTIISDTITQKLITLALEELGPPPAGFAFIALGSEGRSEQTLATDQDNAIIYEDVEEGKSADAQAWFLKLGEYVCSALNSVGYEYCKGNVMAKNPRWCVPLREWKEYFRGWVNTANPQDLLEVNIFFDFRHVYGDETLTEALGEHLRKVTSGNNAFFVYLTQNALKIKPPSWQFKAAEIVDIKSAMLPLIDLSRIYALKHKVTQTNTVERMNALLEKDVFSVSGQRDMLHAYTFLMALRYQHQARRIAGNAAPDNKLHTQELSDTEKLVLKRVLSQIEDFQTKLSLDFRGTMQ